MVATLSGNMLPIKENPDTMAAVAPKDSIILKTNESVMNSVWSNIKSKKLQNNASKKSLLRYSKIMKSIFFVLTQKQ